jgi:hypothetical protein
MPADLPKVNDRTNKSFDGLLSRLPPARAGRTVESGNSHAAERGVPDAISPEGQLCIS